MTTTGSTKKLLAVWRDKENDLGYSLLGRPLTADEVAEMASYLASAKNSVITGTTIIVDGGASLGLPRSYPAYFQAQLESMVSEDPSIE